MLDLTRPPTRLTQVYTEPKPDVGITQTDCGRTSLAMVLGMASPEDVPHHNERQWEQEDRWLRERGAQVVYIPLPGSWGDRIEGCLGTWLRGCPAILQGRTSEGHEHVVAVLGDRIVDTVDYTVGNPLVQPSGDGFYWLALIVPMRRREA